MSTKVISYEEIEKMYSSTVIKWINNGPAYITVNSYKAISQYLEEEVDPFDEWVGQVKAEARKPKNSATREFLDRRYNAGRYRR
jgi:hypothetical protein